MKYGGLYKTVKEQLDPNSYVNSHYYGALARILPPTCIALTGIGWDHDKTCIFILLMLCVKESLNANIAKMKQGL